jgi:hypothetical protein
VAQAFTIYTFFQLMINYVGGERALIVMMHGRAPVDHLWPLNHVLPKVDISDPHEFLAIKRGILQYTWLKPILALAAIIMKACGVYQEGYIGLKSGYFWSGIIYNVSVTISLYALGMFWVCMHKDLKPFRPVPKFLCIKLIIFASYWQGFFLSILVWVGAIPDTVEGYSPDNLAAAIQDALICIEMPIFAVAHWYAFSWKDFANNNIQSARMTVGHAVRDAFGPIDLIQDTKETLSGDRYGYRSFDAAHNILAHEESNSRIGRLKAGMRYERGGKGKYWIPQPGDISAKTPLLGPAFVGSTGGGESSNGNINSGTFGEEEITLDDDEERLYDKARELEFGDWNVSVLFLRGAGFCSLFANHVKYPVITASEPLHERYISQTRYARPSRSQDPRGKRKQVGPVATDVISKKKKKTRARKPHDSQGGSSSTGASGDVEQATETPSAKTTDANQSEESESLLAPKATEEDEEPVWSARDSEEETISPSYQVDGADEFRNVWGNSSRSSRGG